MVDTGQEFDLPLAMPDMRFAVKPTTDRFVLNMRVRIAFGKVLSKEMSLLDDWVVWRIFGMEGSVDQKQPLESQPHTREGSTIPENLLKQLSGEEKSTGESMALPGFMKNLRIVQTSEKLETKLSMIIHGLGAPVRKVDTYNKPINTLEDAARFLYQEVSMANPPAACATVGEWFVFSGGTSTSRTEDFSTGFAIKKGEAAIYRY
jgi:hypothetical protein